MYKMMLVLAMGTAAVFAAEQKNEVVNFSDLNQESLEEFTQGKLQNTIVACPAGMVLPLTLSLQGEFLALESKEAPPAYVKVLKTCFVKCTGETFFFSLDGKNWKDFSEFFTGRLGAVFGINDHLPFARIDCELNQKH